MSFTKSPSPCRQLFCLQRGGFVLRMIVQVSGILLQVMPSSTRYFAERGIRSFVCGCVSVIRDGECDLPDLGGEIQKCEQ